MPKIIEDENKKQTGSTEKPELDGSEKSSPDNATLGIPEEEETNEPTEETSEESSGVESEETTTSETDEENTDEEVSEVEELRKKVIALQQLVDGRKKQQDGDGGEESLSKQENSENTSSADKTAEEISSFVGDFSDEEFDKITSDKKAFVDFLDRFGTAIQAKTKESTYKDIPDIVSQSFMRQKSMNDARDEFYQKNPDLKKYSDYVGFVLNQKQSQNPEKEISDLLGDVEKEVRKNLSINRTAVERENERQTEQNSRRPASPGSGRGSGRNRSTDTRTDTQKQIDEILI